MVHEIRMKRLAYDSDVEVVSVEMIGAMGGRNVELHLRFPFRAHADRPGVDLRRIALLEMQQILRSASNITLPESTDPKGGIVATAPGMGQTATANWESEGGAPRAERREIVWFET